MSLANLFKPNDYDLFCNSITPAGGSGGGGGIFTDNIDTVNTGDTLTIGLVKAGAITIGHPAVFVTTPNLAVTSGLKVDTIQANTSVAMSIGANAAGMNLLPTNGNIVIDDSAPIPANSINIAPIGINGVNIGNGSVTSQITLFSPLKFQFGATAMNNYEQMATFTSAVTGAVAAANFIKFDGDRIGSNITGGSPIVRISWRFLGPAVAATAASVLNITTVLPVGFRPPTQVIFACSCLGTTQAPLPVSVNTPLPGELVIQSTGAMFFQFMPATHNSAVGGVATAGWVIGEIVATSSGSAIFDVA